MVHGVPNSWSSRRCCWTRFPQSCRKQGMVCLQQCRRRLESGSTPIANCFVHLGRRTPCNHLAFRSRINCRSSSSRWTRWCRSQWLRWILHGSSHRYHRNHRFWNGCRALVYPCNDNLFTLGALPPRSMVRSRLLDKRNVLRIVGAAHLVGHYVLRWCCNHNDR